MKYSVTVHLELDGPADQTQPAKITTSVDPDPLPNEIWASAAAVLMAVVMLCGEVQPARVVEELVRRAVNVRVNMPASVVVEDQAVS